MSLFQVINLETCGFCSGKCRFCPYPDRIKQFKPDYMPWELREKIIKELGSLGYSGQIRWNLFNEPFLDKILFRTLEVASKEVSGAYNRVVTNGFHLTEMVDSIIRSPIDKLVVSLHATDAKTHSEIFQRKGYNKVLQGIYALLDARESRPRHLEIGLAFINSTLNEGQFALFEEFWRRQGVKEFWRGGANNRLGNNPGFSEVSGRSFDKSITKVCKRVFKQLCVTHTGEVVLCCNCWFNEEVLGDIKTQTLSEVWNSPRFEEIRSFLKVGNRAAITACSSCSE